MDDNTKHRELPNLHKMQALTSDARLLTIRIDRLVICSMESTPETLPAARALALCATNFSLSNMFSQYLQYHLPRGMLGKEAHSVFKNKSKTEYIYVSTLYS